MKKSMDSNKPLERLQISIKNASNKTIPLGLSVSPMTSSNTKFTGCVGILRDLSEVKDLEEKLKHAERLSYLGKMASWVAHEIRNPLTAIDGFSQLLAHTEDKKKIRTFSDEIHKGTKRINHIIEDILTFARTKPRVRTSDIDLHKLMTQITETIPNVKFFIKGDENPIIVGEEESLKSLFTNIINNSIEAMDKDPMLVIDFHKRKQWVVTEIIDNGKGISQDDLKKLFTPFFTTKSRGTGLGLAIVKKIVDDHNGKVEFESDEGKGTTCRIHLFRKEI
jgi:two-component system nitrogen regulation sensor histidine kinase GlnL